MNSFQKPFSKSTLLLEGIKHPPTLVEPTILATRLLLHLGQTVCCSRLVYITLLRQLVSVPRGHHPLANPAADAG